MQNIEVKPEEINTSVIGALIMYPMFMTFAAIELAVAPIRFVNDRVKNEEGDSITDILRDAFKKPVSGDF